MGIKKLKEIVSIIEEVRQASADYNVTYYVLYNGERITYTVYEYTKELLENRGYQVCFIYADGILVRP